MECKVCGRHTTNEDANFCDYCGSSYKEKSEESQDNQDNTKKSIKDVVYSNNTNYKQDYNKNQGQPVSITQGEDPVSFGNWLLTLLFPVLVLLLPIPLSLIGIIIYIVLLFLWAFDKKTSVNKKNWARAQLIVSLVMIIFFVGSIIFMFGLISSGAISLPDIAGLEGIEGFY